MKQISKLKPTNSGQSIIIGSLVVILLISTFGMIRTLNADRTADILSSVFCLGISIFGLIFWIKTRLVVIIPGLLMNLMWALHFFFYIRTLAIIINVILLLISIYMFFIFYKHLIRYRNILELAATPVEDVKNGFTERPFPAGKVEFTQGEIFGFAEFLKNQIIAIPYQESNGIIFTIPEDWFGRLYDLHGSYLNETRIFFQYDGHVSAQITEKDYKQYKKELTFDQLCASLGNLFIEFLTYFKNGESHKIIDMLKK